MTPSGWFVAVASVVTIGLAALWLVYDDRPNTLGQRQPSRVQTPESRRAAENLQAQLEKVAAASSMRDRLDGIVAATCAKQAPAILHKLNGIEADLRSGERYAWSDEALIGLELTRNCARCFEIHEKVNACALAKKSLATVTRAITDAQAQN